MFGNDSGFRCMMDRFWDRFWYACLDIFGAIFYTNFFFSTILIIFGQVLVCIFGHFWCNF